MSRHRSRIVLAPLDAGPLALRPVPAGAEALALATIGDTAGRLIRFARTGSYALLTAHGSLQTVDQRKAEAAWRALNGA